MLRLVGTGIDGQSRSFDVMEISRPDGLGDLANLGLTLAEAKQLLADAVNVSMRTIVHKRLDAERKGFEVISDSISELTENLDRLISHQRAHDSPHLQLVHYFVRSGRESPGRCLLLVTGHDTTARKPVELRRRVRTGGDCRTHHSTAL